MRSRLAYTSKRTSSLVVLAMLAGSAVAQAASGGAPLTMAHSGYLLDATDHPLSTNMTMRLRVYDAVAAGNLQWEGECASVQVLNGYYTVMLGSSACVGSTADGLDPTLDTNDLPTTGARWLEVGVAGISLSPRMAIGTVPTAAVSNRALTADLLGTHPAADFALASSLATVATSGAWNDLANKPAAFPPSAHAHALAEVTGLQTALDGKAAVSHAHAIADMTGLQTALDGKLSAETDPKVGALTDGKWCTASAGRVVCASNPPAGGWTLSGTDLATTNNVGIGTATPQRALHVKDVMRLEPRPSFPSSPGAGDFFLHTSGQLYLYTGASWKSVLLTNGNEYQLPAGITLANVLNRVLFNTSVSDDGANGAGTTLTGNVSYALGVYNQAGSVFSTTNGVNLTRTTLSSLTATGMTAAAWVKGTDTSATASAFQVANNVFGDTHGSVWMGAGVAQGKAAVRGNSTETRSTASVADGGWHHIAFVFTYSATTWSVQIYVDGNPDGSGTLPTEGNAYFAFNSIGRTYTGYTQYFGYAIDQALLFSKALTAAQIAELRNLGL